MILNKKFNLTLRWIILSALIGLFAGVVTALFLISLEWITQWREGNINIIWLLPLAGFLIGWIYHRFGQDIAGGNNLIIDEIHHPQKRLPFYMTPLVLVGTLVTHLFGGSAGREGTAVQMGASLADQLHYFFKIKPEERKILLVAGAGAGFGAALGAPWAGMIFGMEMIQIGQLRWFAWFQCLVSSFVSFKIAIFLGAPHAQFPVVTISDWSWQLFFWIVIAGIFFGFSAKLFSLTIHFVERVAHRFVTYPPLKPFFGGLILVFLFYWEGSYRYAGLGISHIQLTFDQVASFRDPVFKSLFTSLTVGTGFKGGEFIPLVFIGTTLGSALSVLLPVARSLLAALGFVAVFGAASNTPITCTILAMELFGPKIGPLACVACFISYYFSGHAGIYKSQRIQCKKHKRLFEKLLTCSQLIKQALRGK